MGNTSREDSHWGRGDLLALALLIGSCLLLFQGFIRQRGILVSAPLGDGFRDFFLWRYYGFNALRTGHIPFWSPLWLCGTPFLAESQTALFYPGNLVFLVLPFDVAFNVSFVGHILLASVGVYIFGRYLGLSRTGATFSALAFTYGAPVILHVLPGHLSNICTISWIPWAFLVAEALMRRRRLSIAVVGGILLGVQLLAGHAQYWFYTVLGVGTYSACRIVSRLWRERSAKAAVLHLAHLALMFGLALSVAAIQVLPTREMNAQAARAAAQYDWFAMYSFPPENALTAFMPTLFGDGRLLAERRPEQIGYWGRWLFWEMSAYVGVAGLVMWMFAVAFGRRSEVFILAILGAVGFALALGAYTPLFRLLYLRVPGFNLFRGNSKFIILYALSTSLLAGMGLDLLGQATGSQERLVRRRAFVFTLTVLAVPFLVLVLLHSGSDALRPLWAKAVSAVLSTRTTLTQMQLSPRSEGFAAQTFPLLRQALAVSTAWMMATLVFLVLGARGVIRARHAKLAITALLAVELLWYSRKSIAGFSFDSVDIAGDSREFLASQPGIFRVAAVGLTDGFMQPATLSGLQTAAGVSPNVSLRYHKYVSFSQGRLAGAVEPLLDVESIMRVTRPSKLYSILNTRFFLCPKGWTSPADEEGLRYDILHSRMMGTVALDAWERLSTPKLLPVFEGNTTRVFENADAVPRAYVVYSSEIVKEPLEILTRLASDQFDPLKTVILETKPPPPAGDTRDPALRSGCDIKSYDAHRVVIDVELERDGFLVLADQHYPGWVATVDGKAAEIMHANYVVRAISVAQGHHRAEFGYVPRAFLLGRNVTLATLLLCVAALTADGLRGRKPRGKT